MLDDLREVSKQIRLNILRLAYGRGRKGTHIAPALSMTEIMTVLFCRIIGINDKFILSKGHGALCYYCAMYQTGHITKEQLDSFDSDGGDFPGQPSRSQTNSIQYSSGSLGLGLSYAVGLALMYQKQQTDARVYALLGDGELNEGSVWEAVMLAKHLRLENLIAIVDWNGMQSDGKSDSILSLDIENLWRAHGWYVITCDGHNEEELLAAFHAKSDKMPKVILAKTVKGKGVSFIENDKRWHHSNLTHEQYSQAIMEVQENGF